MMGGPTMPAAPRAWTDSGERLARGVYRFREHILGPDRRPEAEPVTFTMRCATCDASGPASVSGEDGTAWAVTHLKAQPDHVDYREHIVRPYRAEPGAWL
jgi:hypothetical protein